MTATTTPGIVRSVVVAFLSILMGYLPSALSRWSISLGMWQ